MGDVFSSLIHQALGRSETNQMHFSFTIDDNVAWLDIAVSVAKFMANFQQVHQVVQVLMNLIRLKCVLLDLRLQTFSMRL